MGKSDSLSLSLSVKINEFNHFISAKLEINNTLHETKSFSIVLYKNQFQYWIGIVNNRMLESVDFFWLLASSHRYFFVDSQAHRIEMYTWLF